jgi:hypothetical protein
MRSLFEKIQNFSYSFEEKTPRVGRTVAEHCYFETRCTWTTVERFSSLLTSILPFRSVKVFHLRFLEGTLASTGGDTHGKQSGSFKRKKCTYQKQGLTRGNLPSFRWTRKAQAMKIDKKTASQVRRLKFYKRKNLDYSIQMQRRLMFASRDVT